MGTAYIFKKLKIAVAFAAFSSMVFTSIGAAQTNEVPPGTTTSTTTTTTTAAQAPTGPFVVSLQTPASGARIGGNTTFTGAAVDCGRGIAATRVAVYDGNDRNGTYIADAALDTNRPLARYCSNQNGTGMIGFTLITDTRQWRDGPHTLAFVADFPGGVSSTMTTQILLDNYARNYDPFYGPRSYGYGGGYGGGYGLGYGGYNPYYNNLGYTSFGSGVGYSGGYGSYGYPYGTSICNAYYNGYYGCGGANVAPTYSPYSISSCTVYNCGGGIVGNTGCVAYPYSAACPRYYSAYAYPYTNYGVYTAGVGYNASNCAYYYIAYTGCSGIGGIGSGYNYGSSSITLNQAGQSVRLAGPIVLSGFATCAVGGVNTVTLTDRTANATNVIGSTTSAGSYSIVWVPVGGLGPHIIQVTASGGCGTFSQSFSIVVIP